MYEKSDEKDLYKKGKSFQIDNNAVKIRHLALSPTNEGGEGREGRERGKGKSERVGGVGCVSGC
eukprot:1462623-Rhodomonas_salina.1